MPNCVGSGSIGENELRELKLRDIEQSGRRRFGLGCGRRERQGADGKKQQGDEATHRYLPKFGEWAAVSVAAQHRSGRRCARAALRKTHRTSAGWGKRVSVRVGHGGRSVITTNN